MSNFGNGIRYSLIGASAIAIVAAAPAMAQAPVRQFDIPSQPLSSALLEFSRQSDVLVVVAPDLTQGKRSRSLRGSFPVNVAIGRLLAGSHLRAVPNPKGGYRIEANGALDTAKLDVSPAAGEAVAGGAEDYGESEEIVVTGTNIRGAAPVGSPLISLGRVEIDRSGAATVDQFLRTVPQNLSDFDPASTLALTTGPKGSEANKNSSLGTSPNIHGIGLGATLTLVDGRRLAPGGFQGNVVDVSVIPLAAIERVEILTDGASAIYGADAVGGVINFVLRRDFEGAQTTARYGTTTSGGGTEVDLSQLVGTNWGSGNVFAAYSYSDRNQIRAGQREFVTTSESGSRPTFSLSPDQTTHSGIATLRQNFGEHIEIDVSGSVADKQTGYTNAYRDDVELYEINQRDYGLSGGARFHFSPGWDLSGEFQYYKSSFKFDAQRTIGDFSAESDTRLVSGDMKLQGELFRTGAGATRAIVGASVRSEDYKFSNSLSPELIDSSRTVRSLYGELLVPLFSNQNQNRTRFMEKLVISLAGRYDRYPSFGSTVNPKIGVGWGPFASLALRASYGTSFKPPSLYQLVPGLPFTYVLLVPDPESGDDKIALVRELTSNPDLQPEKSKSYSAGFDFKPPSLPGLTLSSTYFDIEYTNKIGSPPVAGGLFGFLAQPELADLVELSPSASSIQALMDAAIAVGTYYDFSGCCDEFGNPDFSNGNRAASDIQVFFDAGIQNAASTRTRGIDVNGSYAFALANGRMNLSLAGVYILEQSIKNTPNGPNTDTAGFVFQVPKLRGRLGATWTAGAFAGTLNLNHTSSFDNPYTTPRTRVRSYQTADLLLSYGISDRNTGSVANGTNLSLVVVNLFAQKPPRVLVPANPASLGFDAANASARGRFIALQISKKW